MVDDKLKRVLDTDLPALEQALRAGQLSGKADIVRLYEAELAATFGTPYAIAVSSGSSALQAALYASGVRAGTEILVSALAPPPTVMPILTLGAVPIFVDCKSDSFDFHLADLASKANSRTRAILAVHMWGYPTAIASLAPIARDLRVSLIEDAAQAHFSIVDTGGFAGALTDLGCFSTQERKILFTGEGGFILSHDKALAETIRAYITIGGPGGNNYGINAKLPALSGALGRSRLPHAREELLLCQARLRQLAAALSGTNASEMQCSAGSRANGYAMVVTMPSVDGAHRVSKALHDNGIPSEDLALRRPCRL